LERHLRAHGCFLAREGGNHPIGKNPANGKVAPIPRHREVKEGTARAVCRQLEIPKP
jgi:predicted RNA binding protein YcfA (HicA-like mRNA interferase family)